MRHPPAKSGFTLRRGAAQADFFEYSPDFGHKKRTVLTVLFVLLLRYYGIEKQVLYPRIDKAMFASLRAVMTIPCG